MISSFFGLHLASKALATHQRALEAAGHNIANAYTEGYSRQLVNNTAGQPVQLLFGAKFLNLGTGVVLNEIRRARDIFLDDQVRAQTWIHGKWEVKRNTLAQIEDVLREPSDYGLSTTLTNFLNSWHDLTSNPDNTAIRSNIREKAKTLIGAFKHTYNQLARLQSDLNEEVKAIVYKVNTYTEEIARLNSQINEATALGATPNDFMDQRDLLIDKLAKLVNIQVASASNNQVNVFIKGRSLVREDESTSLVADMELVAPGLDQVTQLVAVRWSSDMAAVEISDGTLDGILELRDQTIVNYADKLDSLVAALVEDFNNQHQKGYSLDGIDGIDFFQGTSVNDFALSVEVEASLNAIAVAGDNPLLNTGPGDSANALLLAQLKTLTTHGDPPDPLSPLDGSTFEDFYASFVATLGIESAESVRMQQNQEFLLAQLEQRRQSVQGVSLDEEMANMLLYQKAYEASARVVTIMDEMLDTIVNRMGLVGR